MRPIVIALAALVCYASESGAYDEKNCPRWIKEQQALDKEIGKIQKNTHGLPCLNPETRTGKASTGRFPSALSQGSCAALSEVATELIEKYWTLEKNIRDNGCFGDEA